MRLFSADLRLIDGANLSRFAALAEQEARAVYAIAEDNRLEAMFLYGDNSGAILILRANDKAAAATEIQTLPYVKEGLLTALITPLVPYPPLASLYGKDGRALPEWWSAAVPGDH